MTGRFSTVAADIKHVCRSRSLAAVIMLCQLLSTAGSAQQVPKTVFTGTLVDVTCATDAKRDLAKLRSEHSRKCLLMPACVESGYAVLTDKDDVLRFDRHGNEEARSLIEKHSRNKNWRVSVDAAIDGSGIRVLHIKLKKS
jgi:hypothetical protein